MKKYFHRGAEWFGNALGSPYAIIVTAAALYVGQRTLSIDEINFDISQFTLYALIIIQATQNRNDRALHLKIDELLRSHEAARNEYMKAETQDDEAIKDLAAKVEEKCDGN